MIDWLNKNQGFVTAMLTLVYVLTTIGLAYIAQRSHDTSQKQLKFAIDLEQQRSRPFVSFNIVTRNGFAYATLLNSGQTAAFDVSINIEPKLFAGGIARAKESSLTKTSIQSIPPNHSWKDLLDSTPSFFEVYKDPIFRGKISYRDREGTKYDEELIVDLRVHLGLLFTPEPDIAKEIKSLTEAVKRFYDGGNSPETSSVSAQLSELVDAVNSLRTIEQKTDPSGAA